MAETAGGDSQDTCHDYDGAATGCGRWLSFYFAELMVLVAAWYLVGS